MIKVIKRVLILAGKPVYFVLSRLILGISTLFYTPVKTGKKQKRTKVVYKRLGFPKLIFPKLSFPKLKFPKVTPKLKLEELEIALLELKILSRLKKFFSKKLTRLQKLRLKISVRFVVISVIIVSLFSYSYFAIFKGLPSPKELEARQTEVSTKIYDRNGILLYKIYKNQNRTIVPLTKIPIHVRLATLAAEDAEFYSHPGFSIKGIFRAIIQDLQTGSIQGGSTITQQLVKNTLLTPEKTITRKIKELILSIEVEANYTKDQILEMYLNEVSYGGTAYGIQEASESYFGKDVGSLNLAEAALLAGLPKSPTAYSPFGPTPELAIERQKEILHLMVVNKFITSDQEKTALKEILTFLPNKTSIKAPHFVMYIRQLLVDKYGEDVVEKGGLEVITSLDLPIQETAEQVVQTEVAKLRGLNVGNGAALVVNPQTGEILAMVGSKNYFDIAAEGNVNVTTSLRQPGSSIKVVNYAYALSNGYTPATIIDDSKVTYAVPGNPPYSPVNYDNQYKGPIPLRSALAQSRNIPAVKVLASYGVAKMVSEGQKMGITTWSNPSDYGLSLTLGGGAVTVLDLSKVYSTLANYGKRPDFLPILSVKNYKGRVLEKNTPVISDAVDPRVAFILTDILKDNNARAPEFGLASYLVIKNHPEVAVKTGTSNDLRDNWTAGYSQDYLVVTWVGNNDNSPMSRVASGVTGASPIWNKIMSAILNDKPSIDWKVPDGVVRINCPGKSEWFLKENVLPNYCRPLPSPTPVSSPNPILPDGASTRIRR